MLRFRLPEKLFHGGAEVDNGLSIVTTGPVATEAIEEPAVAQFLDDVVQRLAPLTDDVRAGIRQELRVHLEALIVAHEELGDNHEAAATAAIRQFGEPHVIARRFRRAWAATPADTPRAAMREALRVVGIGIVIGLAGLLRNVPSGINLFGAVNDALTTGWLWGMIWAIPIVTGVHVGWKFPRSGSIGVLLALVLLTAATLPAYIWGNYCQAPSGTVGFSSSWWLSESCCFLVPIFLFWAGFSLNFAFVTGALKQWQAKRRLDCLPFVKG